MLQWYISRGLQYNFYNDTVRENEGDFPDLVCYRESIESRIPGVVFCIEFYPLGKMHGKRITILEEERLADHTTENIESYYKDRLIHVFLKPGYDVEETLRTIKNSI